MTKLTVADVRAKFPQYEDLSDEQLLEGVRRKFYSDIPRETFFGNFGLKAAPAPAADQAPPRAPRAPVVNQTPPAAPAPQPPATPEAALADLMAAPSVPEAPPAMTAPPAMPAPSAPASVTIDAATGPTRLQEVAPPRRPASMPLEAAPKPDTRFTPRATLAPADDPLIAAMRGETPPAPPATSSRDLTGSRAPSDPFEGEGFGALATRRGQQFAQGATDVAAAVPEALAIQGEIADRSRAAGAAETLTQREQTILDIGEKLLDPNLDEGTRAVLERTLADLTEGQGVIEGMRDAPIQPAQDRDLYAAGDKIRDAVDEVVGAPDPRDQSFWADVARGGGNMVGMIGAAAAGTMAGGPVAGATVGAMSGAAMNQAQVFEEAVQSGADQETALQASKWATVIGASEIIPITRALKLLPPRLRGELTTGMMRKFVDIAQASGEEAAQEYLAQVANNIVAQQLYDPERGWTEGAGYSALVGAVLGAGVGTAGVMLEGQGREAPPQVTAPPRKPEQPQTPEDALAAAMAPTAAPTAPAAPAQPAQPQADTQPVTPEAPPAAPEDEITAAMGGQPADPTEGGRYEILDEIENTPGGPVATGRKVRVDLETGQATVVGADGTPAQAGGAPGAVGSAGQQPQAEDVPAMGAGDVPPAAGRAPEDDIAAAMGAEATPQDETPAPTYGVGAFDRPAEGNRPAARIEVSREGPFDFSTRFPAPDPRLLDALEREGRNTFEGDPTPEQVAGILDEAMNDAEQDFAALQGWQAEAEKLAKVTKPSSQIPSGKNNGEAIKLEIAQKNALRAQRDFDDTIATIADVWGQDVATQFRDEAMRRARGDVRPIQWPNEGQKPSAAAPEDEIAAAMGGQPEAGATPAPFVDGFDVGARASRFPTTLEEIATPPAKGERGRQTHIYAEIDGKRYYLASVTGNADSATQEWAKTYPQARILTTDRADSTSINGEVPELDAAIAAKAGGAAPAAPATRPAADPMPEIDSIDFNPVRRDTARTPAGTEIEVEYAIIELDDLIASNLPDGRVNPDYPQERQPRDRTKDASERQIQRIMRDFDPRQLLESPTTDTGAMIVDRSGYVESGNGRTLALQRIYAERPDLVRAYLEALRAGRYPIDKMDKPVLVRIRRTEMTDAEIEAYTRESNTDTKLAMSATEQAMADANALPDSALDLYRGGDIDTAANRDFVRAFIQAVVTENEQGKMIAPDGSMSQDAVRRVQAALLAKAYGDQALVAKLIESADNNIKSIGGALLDVSAAWAKMRSAARAGSIAPEMDQTEALIEAVRLVDRARAEKRNVIEYVKQPDLLSGEGISPMGQRFLALMFRDTRQWTKPAGRDNLARWLGYYVDEAMKSAPGADLFGAAANPGGTLDLAKEKQDADEKGSGGQQADLFAPRPAGSDGAGVRPADGGGTRPGAQGTAAQDGEQRPAGQPEGVKPPTVTSIGTATFAQWQRSLPSPGTVRGWRIFDDRAIGNRWVLMTRDKMAGPFPDEAAARAWAQVNPAATTEQTPDATTPKPTPILDELQRAIDARKALLRPGESTVPDGHVDYMLDSSTSLWKRLAKATTEAERHAAAADWLIEMAAKKNVEYLVVFDRQGQVIAAMRGTKSAVSFPDYISRAMIAGEIGYNIHNHPSNRGVSINDLKAFAGGMENLAVVGTSSVNGEPKGEHLIQRGPAFNGNFGRDAIEQIHKAATKELTRRMNLIVNEHADRLRAALPKTGTQAERDAAVEKAQAEQNAFTAPFNFAFDHVLTLALARMGIINYTGNSAEIARAVGVNPDDFFDDLFAAVQPVAGRIRLQLTRRGDTGGNRAPGSDRGADGPGSAAGAAGGTAGLPRDGDGRGRSDQDGEDLADDEADDDGDYTPPTDAEKADRDRKRAEAEAADRAKHPVKWKLIDAGYVRIFFSNDGQGESTSLRNLATPSEPGRGVSRALQFPFVWTKDADGTEGLVASLPPLLDKTNDRLWPDVAKMRADLEALTGLSIKPRGRTLPGNLGQEMAGYHHAVDLLSAGMVERLLETRMLSTPKEAASAVSYAVHYTGEKPPKGQKRTGHITADQGALVLREFGIPEPTAAEIEDYLARYASIGRTEQGEALNFNDYGKDVPLGMRAWAEIHLDRKGWHPFRNRFREPSAEFKAWLEANRPGDGPSTPSDTPPKTRAPKSGKPSSGNADLDAALDDIFGDDDVSGTGGDLERDSGDADPQDDMGGTDVPPAAGGSRPGAGKRGGKGGGTGGKRGGRRSIPGGDAPPVGGGSDQGVDGGGGTKRRPSAGGNGGRGAGAGAGGSSPDTGRGQNPAGTSAGGTRVTLTDAERAAAIRDILKENLERMIDRPSVAEGGDQVVGDGLDPRKYEALEALFIDGVRAASIDAAKASDRDIFRAIAVPLKNAGLDRETIVKMAPYLEAFARNVKSGRVNLDPEPDAPPAEDKAEIQRKADRIKPVMADEANIRATLPLLLPEQQEDVMKIERRFAKPDGHGMLITNGTGTGKTFTGGGQIKRFVQMGKGEILIIAPSKAVIAGWKRALEAMGVEVNHLRNTKDAGKGVVITTYANFYKNKALASRRFDLVVADESQSIMANKKGKETAILNAFRAHTHRPADLWRKSRMRHADAWARYKKMRDGEAKTQEYRRLKAIEDAEVAALAQEPRSKVLFLSATPFARDISVDYAEGYLFDYPKDGIVGNSHQSGRNLFMVQNFGYRIRYHKLTQPESAVDRAVFEREFHERLKREGVLSGRSLQIDVDYDRKFVTVADAIGTKIDAIMDTLRDGLGNPDKAMADGYLTISTFINRRFNYLKRMQLLEAIKAKAAIEDIKAHLALGRKVVVFHDFNKGGGFNPFGGLPVLDDANAIKALADLVQKHPDINELDFTGYLTPPEALKKAFGKRAEVFSGTVQEKPRLAGLAKFNTDDSGTDILIVQSDAGGAGISMHDLTGTHQRVLINLGMPTKPTTTLQEEGRILRVGTVTDAIFRYYTIGTAWEREAFARQIAERSGTVENLALGNQARALREAFIEAYMEAEPRTPSLEDGKGGKAKDGAGTRATPYEIAKTHYFGRTKIRGRRDQRDGIDFYPTAEPLAFKMVEWAGLRPNERVLEPSAGDGAIARYFPDDVAITLVEPSNDLGSRALLRAPSASLSPSTFEDYHIVNKHHVIVMNPPFGSGGATAMEHLSKAARHLRDGGRIVALIPTGPSADKRWDAWWNSKDAEEFNWTADITLPGVAFERAGTGVMTRVVILDKISDKNERAYFGSGNGGTKRINFTGAKDITDFFDRLEGIDVPRRPDPKRDVVDELEDEAEAAAAALAPSVKPGAALTTGQGGFKLGNAKHGKTGDDLFVATIANFVERNVYEALKALAKQHGGWYSNFKGPTAIPGFQFKSEAARAAFLEDAAKPTVGSAPDGVAETAYHGSPSDHDRFSLDYIGSGEGAQAYGWGLYFASQRRIAEYYRSKLTVPQMFLDGEVAPAFMFGARSAEQAELVEEYLRSRPAQRPPEVSEKHWQGAQAMLKYTLPWNFQALRDKMIYDPSDDLKKRLRIYQETHVGQYDNAVGREDERAAVEAAANLAAVDWLMRHAEKRNAGALFTVEIPDAPSLLDWDATMADQPEAVRTIINKRLKRRIEGARQRMQGDPQIKNRPFEDLTGEEIYEILAIDLRDRAGYGTYLSHTRYHQQVSEMLRGYGIPGHRYLDGMSRNAGDGTHNFVIYDDAAVKIIEKQQRAQMLRESEASTSEILRLMPRLRAELDRLDLKRVKLYFDPLETDWQGFFQVSGDGDFEVVIGASLDPMKTLHHEVIHIMRTMNLFTPEEWKALEIAAGKGWMEKHDIEARYPNLTHEERLEEAIAEEFSWALENQRAPKGGLLIQAFNKIHRLLKAIRNVFRGAGFNTPEDIFGRILSGEISKRQAWNTGYYARMGYNLQAKAPRDTATGDLFAQPEEPKRTGMTDDQRRELEARQRQSKMRKVGGNSGDAGPLFDDQADLFGQRRLFQAPPAPTPAEVETLAERIKADLGLRDLSMFLSGRSLKVNMLAVARNDQGQGKGSEAMRRITGFADARGLRVVLSPGQRDDGFGTTSRGRLVEFYKRFGFVENKGRAKDFAISEGMYREPRRGPQMQARPAAMRPLTPQGRVHRNTAMGGALFIPDRRVWEELTRAGVPVWQRLRNGRGAASDALDRARQVIQDRFLPVLRAQEAIMRATGRNIAPEQNAYIAETTFSGKVGRHLLDIDEAYAKPIIDIIAKTDGGLTLESVGEWLYARHAIERNAYIASINPDMPDGGSGMTDQDAQDILSDAAAGPHAAQLQQIGALIDGLRERTLKLREDAGLITNAEADMWRKQYKHYVPLKGFAETDHAEAVLDVTGVGKRYSIRGQESRRALGRGSEAFNPLQAALTQAQEVSIRAEKNRVGQALYELAKGFPSKALWEIKTPAQKRYFNRSTGLVETRVEDPVSLIMDPNEMAVKVAGKEVRILLKDDRLARAMNTVGADQMSGFLRVMSMFSRFFSMTRTMLNPEFMVTNAFRDFQTAQFNIQAFGEDDRNRIAKAMAKNWRKAFMGVIRGQSYRFDTEWSRYFDEFQKAGAQVWFWTMEQPEAAKDDLAQRIKLARGSRARRVMTFMTTPSAIFSMRDNPALAFIEKTNLAVDNAIRLAAFVEARKAGWTVEQAAFLAKELTVNFNRRGEVGAQMNALYPFFNAAIQGTVRTVKALGSKRVAKMVAVAFAAGVLNDLVNAALSEEDEDEELVYDKIPDYRNERNFHIGWFANSRNPFAIPMPYGYNVFPYAGQQLGKVIRGVKDPDQAFADVMAAAFSAFSPISAATPAQMVSPVISDPIVEMAENKNWLGAPIYPQTYGNQTEPDAYVHFRGATEVSKMVAQALNSLTGGDFRQPGGIDVSPETLDHLATFVTGSAGAFWGRTTDFLAKAAQANFDEIEGRNVPFVRNVFSPVGEWVDRDRFYQFRAAVRDARADAKAYEAAGQPVPPDVAKLAGLYDKLLEVERELNGRGDWNPARANARTPREDVKIYLDFNREYLRVAGKQGQ